LWWYDDAELLFFFVDDMIVLVDLSFCIL